MVDEVGRQRKRPFALLAWATNALGKVGARVVNKVVFRLEASRTRYTVEVWFLCVNLVLRLLRREELEAQVININREEKIQDSLYRRLGSRYVALPNVSPALHRS